MQILSTGCIIKHNRKLKFKFPSKCYTPLEASSDLIFELKDKFRNIPRLAKKKFEDDLLPLLL